MHRSVEVKPNDRERGEASAVFIRVRHARTRNAPMSHETIANIGMACALAFLFVCSAAILGLWLAIAFRISRLVIRRPFIESEINVNLSIRDARPGDPPTQSALVAVSPSQGMH
jgi:hypothetical protein